LERIRKKYPHWSDEEIQKRIATQLPQEEKCMRADLILKN
jgi:dephospho-CoA kinase